MASVFLKGPADCTKEELRSFCHLVNEGGEVAAGSLMERVKRAKALAFMSEGRSVIGVAALKVPSPDYRRRVFLSAKASYDPETIMYELGWIFVHKSHRGKKLSKPLVEKAISNTKDSIYATSRTFNAAMHKTLKDVGFVEEGQKYDSKEHLGETLTLFVLPRVSS